MAVSAFNPISKPGLRTWLLLSVAIVTVDTRAMAQSAPFPDETAANGGTTLNVITVTARRDEEKLASVPVSVGIANKAVIANEAAVNGAIDISRDVPNYTVTDVGNPLYAFGAIRGVGTLYFPVNAFDSTIGYALNGSPISMHAGAQQLLDVDRVEVMRGPQNVLFGRSSQGGTVNIVAGEPDGERNFSLRGEYGTNDQYLADLIAGGTIVPGFMNARGAIRFTGGEGNVRNLSDGSRLADWNIGAARGSARFFLGDSTTITARGYYEHDSRDTFTYILRGGKSYPAVSLDKPLEFDRDLAIGSIDVLHSFDTFDLTATFGIQDITSRMKSDNTDGLAYSALTGLPVSFFSSATCKDCSDYRFKERAYSGEVRARSQEGSDYRWTGGASFYITDLKFTGVNTNSFGATQNGTYSSDLNLQDYSAFGEIDIPLYEKFILTPGLRVGYSKVTRDGGFVSNGTPGTVPVFYETGSVDGAYAAGGITLAYKPDDQSIYYASVKRGYSNAGYPDYSFDSVYGRPLSPYPASSNMTYEAGARTSLFSDRVSLGGSVFFNDVKDGHLTTFDYASNYSKIVALDYDTYGFELDAKAELTSEVSLYGNVGYTHAEFVDVSTGNPSGAFNGGRVPGIPEWSGALGVNFRLPVDVFDIPGDLVANAEFQFTAGRRAATVSNSFDLKNYNIVNANIGWEGEHVNFYAFGRNIFDNKVELAGVSYSSDVLAVTPGQGQTFGLGFKVTY